MEEEKPDKLLRVLCLDGGGAKGFYTLGVLREIEAMIGCRLHERFDLVFGTSTGAIIAALIALGKDVDEIHDLYRDNVPEIMKHKGKAKKSEALKTLAEKVFGELKFDSLKTGLGIVAAKWQSERPMIFKGDPGQAHGRAATFVPGFGITISDAVQASCSAYPFFERKMVTTSAGDQIELLDGGYCANNPTLYALADAASALNASPEDIRVVSIGVGVYPEPKRSFLNPARWAKHLLSVQLLQKTLEINTQSMDQLRQILFKNVHTVRISDTFERPELATDMFEHDLDKLNTLRQLGAESFAQHEDTLSEFLSVESS
ncbi:patatin-like phospholipase family protein [Sphingorhabdus sp. EL138]|uniref:patatin-like phospholipase family protein n=1 Tax=Sphingorhabdus sp. EL138 TaxID=2073156 RepID=UPI000D690AAE|nr:patatin-like phospholipase family protein [Sphingorhabdus sp. EL138]